MSGISFKGVEEAKDILMTRPGTIDVFDIKEVKFDTTKTKGTYYMGVRFARKGDEFTHSFFLTEKALPRIKSLVKMATGETLSDEIQEEQLKVKLEGKKIALKVTGKIDEDNGRAYPDLSFGGFGKSADKVKELEFNDQELEKNRAAAAVVRNSDTSTADKATPPVGGATSTKEEDIF